MARSWPLFAGRIPAGASLCLAGRAPVELAAAEACICTGGGADAARQAGAAVHVVGVLAAGACRARRSRSVGSVVTMRPGAQAGPHQRDEVGPQRRPARLVELAGPAGTGRRGGGRGSRRGRRCRCRPRRPGPSAARRPGPGCGRCGRTPASPSGRAAERVRAEPGVDGVDLRRAEHLARRRPAQVAPADVGDPPHAHRADRRRRVTVARRRPCRTARGGRGRCDHRTRRRGACRGP